MTREEALVGLSSTDKNIRLKAARFFAMNAHSGDRPEMQAALRIESVRWIKRALQRALQRSEDAPETEDVEKVPYADPPSWLIAELRAKTIEELAGTVIHDLATIVATLKLTVRNEMPDYTDSKTENLVNSLESLLKAIRNLKIAAGKAEYIQCNLDQECRSVCSLFTNVGITFHFAGPSPFLIEIDPDLLKLALTNVVRNALEAVEALAGGGDRTITLNWGRAGHECWVTVLDSGLGFERDPNIMVKLGASTKKNQFGYGLAIAKQAMQTMEGDVYPANANGGGARVELRWFVSDENLTR